MNRDHTGVVRAFAQRAYRTLPPLISLMGIAAGYYIIWSVSPESTLKTVIVKTRFGLLLIINGGLLLLISLKRYTK